MMDNLLVTMPLSYMMSHYDELHYDEYINYK